MSAAQRKPKAPDPGTLCRELRGLAAKGELPRLLLLMPPTRGEEEPWFGEQIMDAARGFARSRDTLELFEADGGSPDFDPAALEGFLSAASLFGGERVLVLGRAGVPFTRRPALAEQIVAAAADPAGPRWMVVQISGGKAHQKTAPAGKALAAAARKKEVRVERFRKLYGDPPPWNPAPDASEAAQFVAAEARERKMRLGPGAPGLLVQLAGARPGNLLQALEHFAMLGIDSVDEEQVREVAAHSAEGNAFEFAEAVLTGNGPGALRLLGKLRARGLRTWDGRRLTVRDAYSLLLSVLASERRRTAAVSAGAEQGLEAVAAMAAAGLPSAGPMAQRMRKRLERCDRDQLDRVLGGIRRAERRVKLEGWKDSSHALEELAFHAHQSRRGR